AAGRRGAALSRVSAQDDGDLALSAALLKNLRELRLELARIGLDRIVVDLVELDRVERRQARRRAHVDPRGMMTFLGELVLDLGQQIELREQLGGVGMR